MKTKRSLAEQLLYIYVIVISIIVISLGIILPKTLLPIYEENPGGWGAEKAFFFLLFRGILKLKIFTWRGDLYDVSLFDPG